MKVGAIIAAAGFGRRMKTDRPKQLLVLNDTPILVHTIRKFDASPVIDYIIVTATRDSVEEVTGLVKAAGFTKSVIVIEGGSFDEAGNFLDGIARGGHDDVIDYG